MDDLLDTVTLTLVVNVNRLSCGRIVYDSWGWGDGKDVLLLSEVGLGGKVEGGCVYRIG